jgi:hypothetical protein
VEATVAEAETAAGEAMGEAAKAATDCIHTRRTHSSCSR